MRLSAEQLRKRYIWYRVFRNLWFIGAIWLLFYRLFVTDQQIGILDAISFGIGLLAEIPSGVIADRIGRKRLVIIGTVMASIGIAMQGMATGYPLILLGQVIVSSGWAFTSGADEALFYDAIDSEAYRKNWKQTLLMGSKAELLTTLCSYIVGGYLYSISPRLPFIAMGIISLFGVYFVRGIADLRQHDTQETPSILSDIKDGAAQLTHAEVRSYLPVILLVQGFFYSFGFGLLRPILQAKFGFDAQASSWLIASCGLLAYGLQSLQSRYLHKISAIGAIPAIAISSVAALFFATMPLGRIGGICIAILYAGEYLIDPWVSDGINARVSAKHRATTLSAASFLKAAPYVLLAPIIGYANTHGHFNTYLLACCVSLLAAVFLFTIMQPTKESPRINRV